MNLDILNTEIQDFIDSNLKSDISNLILKGVPFSYIDSKIIIEQIEAKKRCKKKLPTWFNTKKIYYPNKLNIEQTSSEITAEYKANLISGESLIDLTGGFGVDAYYFSKKIKQVTHCEINTNLSAIVKHNYDVLGSKNIKCISENGIDTLKRLDNQNHWIYLDPSRRDKTKQKVFLLSECEPNVKLHNDMLFKYAENVMIKTSPLLDISAALSDLKDVKEIHILAVDNEVKELLWILKRNYDESVIIKTVNIQKDGIQKFDFKLEEELKTEVEYSNPLKYLYEPNSAILKAGAFKTIGHHLKICKLHKHSHLYTSEALVSFPGRVFKIKKLIPFNKKLFNSESITKANITTRNFPISVEAIRKKLKIKDGGNLYLFFTTDINNDKIIIICSKDL